MKIYRTRYKSGHGESAETVRQQYLYGSSVYAGRAFRYGDVLTLNQSAAIYPDASQPQPPWAFGTLPPRHEPFSHKVKAKAEARHVGTAKRFSTTVRVLHRSAAPDPYVALAVAVLERVRSLAERRGVQRDQHAFASDAAEIDSWLRAAAEALIERGSDPLQAARDRGRHQAWLNGRSRTT